MSTHICARSLKLLSREGLLSPPPSLAPLTYTADPVYPQVGPDSHKNWGSHGLRGWTSFIICNIHWMIQKLASKNTSNTVFLFSSSLPLAVSKVSLPIRTARQTTHFWSLLGTLMLGGIGGWGNREWQRIRWLDGITDLMDMNVSELRELVMEGRPGVLWFMGLQRVGHDWAIELNCTDVQYHIICKQGQLYFFFSNLDSFYFFFFSDCYS